MFLIYSRNNLYTIFRKLNFQIWNLRLQQKLWRPEGAPNLGGTFEIKLDHHLSNVINQTATFKMIHFGIYRFGNRLEMT